MDIGDLGKHDVPFFGETALPYPVALYPCSQGGACSPNERQSPVTFPWRCRWVQGWALHPITAIMVLLGLIRERHILFSASLEATSFSTRYSNYHLWVWNTVPLATFPAFNMPEVSAANDVCYSQERGNHLMDGTRSPQWCCFSAVRWRRITMKFSSFTHSGGWTTSGWKNGSAFLAEEQ